MKEYCLLCDLSVDNTLTQHNYHRYSRGCWIEYFDTEYAKFHPSVNELCGVVETSNFHGGILKPKLIVTEEDFLLFKGLKTWEEAKTTFFKLKVFK